MMSPIITIILYSYYTIIIITIISKQILPSLVHHLSLGRSSLGGGGCDAPQPRPRSQGDLGRTDGRKKHAEKPRVLTGCEPENHHV